MFQENKTCQIFRKTNFFYPLIGKRTCAYQVLKNVCFSVKFTCFVFLKHLFLDLPFCLITDLQIHRRIQNPAKHLKWTKKESLVKNNYNLELFRKTRQYIWQGSKYCRTFEYTRVLNMSWIMNKSRFQIYQG